MKILYVLAILLNIASSFFTSTALAIWLLALINSVTAHQNFTIDMFILVSWIVLVLGAIGSCYLVITGIVGLRKNHMYKQFISIAVCFPIVISVIIFMGIAYIAGQIVGVGNSPPPLTIPGLYK